MHDGVFVNGEHGNGVSALGLELPYGLSRILLDFVDHGEAAGALAAYGFAFNVLAKGKRAGASNADEQKSVEDVTAGNALDGGTDDLVAHQQVRHAVLLTNSRRRSGGAG